MGSLPFKEKLLQILWTGRVRNRSCDHIHLMREVTPSSSICEECIALGDAWVGLRMCAICGKVGCCDNSKNHHARAHYRETDHPIIYSDPTGEGWRWCYVEKTLVR